MVNRSDHGSPSMASYSQMSNRKRLWMATGRLEQNMFDFAEIHMNNK